VTIEMLSWCSASLRNGDLGQSDARRLPISPERRPVAAGTGLRPGAPSRLARSVATDRRWRMRS
jgi:hypothetical protein